MRKIKGCNSTTSTAPNSDEFKYFENQVDKFNELESSNELEFPLNDDDDHNKTKRNRRQLDDDDLDEKTFDLNQVWTNDTIEQIAAAKPITTTTAKCGKQAITINFEDISFSDWILEPKSFQSNYCSGTCKYPLDQVIRNYVFNHAEFDIICEFFSKKIL